MINKKIVIGNLKMNQNFEEMKDYINIMAKEAPVDSVVFCPTSLYIPYFKKKNLVVGLQNVFNSDKGAFTGEISPSQARSMEIDYVIIGHSERRIYFGENDLFINSKIKQAIKNNLKVILCVGESNEDRNLLKTSRVLKKQLVIALQDLKQDDLDNVIVAYEPIWAIGTNNIPTNKDISDASKYIKDIVEKNFDYKDIPVIYGGSVNKNNIKELNKIKNISGFLVGGKSIDPKEFLKIIEVVVNQ